MLMKEIIFEIGDDSIFEIGSFGRRVIKLLIVVLRGYGMKG